MFSTFKVEVAAIVAQMHAFLQPDQLSWSVDLLTMPIVFMSHVGRAEGPVNAMAKTVITFLLCRAHIDAASVEVRFNHLSVSAEVAVAARGEAHSAHAYRNKFEVSLLHM